ncbi:alpha/beta fold hydrolase [Niabella sp. CC-SYL272]|uniref:alpha/beta hydrolase n=1 Tax=Niabella agricola TaxID=2891571 RepID=UPI001F1E5836|nr:alpha/beta hydrolase [Niabella agricola]MCF3110310.1 alpha/beta fold hydrolase [Niabella agricola]
MKNTEIAILPESFKPAHLEQKYILYRQSVISYGVSGTGAQPVVCFHGFNESAQAFSVLKNNTNRFTILAIDAPFHGNTRWREGCRFTPDQLHEILQLVLTAESFAATTPLILVGFSLGGRICLSYYQQYPQNVQQLLLLAPDGLEMSFWYWCSAHTMIGNRLFAFTMKHPWWLIKFAGILNKAGVINAGVKKFTIHYLHRPQVRQMLYTTWTAFRFFKPDIAQIKKIIARRQTSVQLYFGKYDSVIPARRGFQFIKNIEPFAQTYVLETGHRLLQDKTVHRVLDLL